MKTVENFRYEELVTMDNFNKRISDINYNYNFIPNANLLRNPCFSVWQRNTINKVSNRDYISADGWMVYKNTLASPLSGGGIRISPIDPIYCITLNQGLEARDILSLRGRTVTLSTMIKGTSNIGTIVSLEAYTWVGPETAFPSGNIVRYMDIYEITNDTVYKKLDVTFKIPENTTGMSVNIVIARGQDLTLDIKYVKLEHGNIATEFVPNSYAFDFSVAQRYYQKYICNYDTALWGNQFGESCAVALSIPEMRLSPRIESVGMYSYSEKYGSIPCTFRGAPYSRSNHMNLWFSIPSHPNSGCSGYIMCKNNDNSGGIFLDAEIY